MNTMERVLEAQQQSTAALDAALINHVPKS